MERLRELRKKLNKTQAEVAYDIGISVQVLSRYELGDREPDNTTLSQLADYFNVTTDFLLNRDKIESITTFDNENNTLKKINNLKLLRKNANKTQQEIADYL